MIRALAFASTLALLLGSATLAPAMAQDDAAARQAVAERVVALTTTGSAVEAMIGAVWPPVEQNVRAQNPDVPAELLEVLRSVMADTTRELVAEMAVDVVAFYAAEFSLAELEALAEFYEGPLGKKVLDVTPKLMNQVMPTMLSKMQQMGPRLMTEMQQAAEARGLKFDI